MAGCMLGTVIVVLALVGVVLILTYSPKPPGQAPLPVNRAGTGSIASLPGEQGANQLRAALFGDERVIVDASSTASGAVQAISFGDLDGDGDLDLLAASTGWRPGTEDDEIAWYENNGSAPPSFVRHKLPWTSDNVHALFVADLDGDGDLDFISASSADDKIVWHENNGESPPAFIAHVVTEDPDADHDNGTNGFADVPESILAADLDGDGDLDLVSASSADDKIAWYENDGRSPPSFTPHSIVEDPDGDPDAGENGFADGANSIHAADLDGDGDIDLISSSWRDDKIAWYENDGAAPPSFYPRTITEDPDGDPESGANGFGDLPVSVWAADLDGDGDLDVLAASHGDGKIAWYENDGASPPVFKPHAITGGTNREAFADGAQMVYAADLDGDGDLDVLSASTANNRIAWYENDGNPFPSFTARVITNAAPKATSVVAADADGDGDIDVFAAGWNLITFHENDGASPPSFDGRAIAYSVQGAQDVYAADVDADGDMDLLSAGGSELAWFENDGLSPPSFIVRLVDASLEGACSVTAADIDGDGDLDLLCASEKDDKIVWFWNDGGRPPVFRPAVVTEDPDGTEPGSFREGFADGVRGIAVADLNGDGRPDLLAASWRESKIAWFSNRSGDSAGQPSRPASTSPAPPDSDPRGRVRFDPIVIASNAMGAQAVFAADLDGDGDVDVLSASVNDDRIVWYENDGKELPSFIARTITHLADGAHAVYAVDLDGDGDMDVLSASSNDNTVAWYENDGVAPPIFTRRIITASAGGVIAIHAADLDGDGDLDVLSASSYDGTISWFENDGGAPPGFTEFVISRTAIRASAVVAVDLDGDGDLDVLVSSSRQDKIAWYENLSASARSSGR